MSDEAEYGRGFSDGSKGAFDWQQRAKRAETEIERLRAELTDRQGHCDFCGLSHDFGVFAYVGGKRGAEACRLRAKLDEQKPRRCGICEKQLVEVMPGVWQCLPDQHYTVTVVQPEERKR